MDVFDVYTLLKRKILRADDVTYGPVANAAFKSFTKSKSGNKLHNELPDKDRKAIMSGLFLNFMKFPPNSLWGFLPISTIVILSRAPYRIG